jgi:hemolysin activation/secretion protein
MSSVRGYLSAEATGDYGVIGSLEMRTPPITLLAPLVNNWRLFTFLDGGHVRLRSPLPEQQDRFSLMSFGIGSSFQVGERVTANFDVGYPLKDGPRTERHSPSVNFNITANY